MLDLTLPILLTRIAVLLPIIAVHGFFLCWGAYKMGDMGPFHDGRMTLNPFAHLDILGALAFAIFGLGWIRPLAIDARELRWRAAGLIPVLICGLAPLVLMAFMAILLLPWAATAFSFSSAPIIGGILVSLARLAVAFALFNLVPLPPLSAGSLLAAARPGWAALLKHRGAIASLVVIALLATSIPGRLVNPVTNELLRLLSGNSAMISRLI